MLYVGFVSLFTPGLHVLFVSLYTGLTTVQSQTALMAIYNLTKSEQSLWALKNCADACAHVRNIEKF